MSSEGYDIVGGAPASRGVTARIVDLLLFAALFTGTAILAGFWFGFLYLAAKWTIEVYS